MISDATLQQVLSRQAVRLWGDLIRATLWMLVVVLLLAYAAVYIRLAALLLARPGHNDFTIFYFTGRMVSEGLPLYADVPEAYRTYWRGITLGNLNPPHFQLLIAPLVPLGYRGALAVWLLFNVAVVVMAWRITVRELAPALTPKRILVALLVIFASAAWTSVAVTGEMSLLLLVPFVLAWRAARHQRWTSAGVWLGLCVAFKPFFLVFVAWLTVARRWRAIGGGLLSALACIVAGASVYGVKAYADWMRGLGRIGWYYLPMNVSLRGLAERLVHSGAPIVPVVELPLLATPLWLTAAASVGAITAWTAWPGRAGSRDVDRLFALLLVAALLVSPLGWIYYLPLATAPVVALALRGQLLAAGRVQAAVFLAGLALLYVPMEITEMGQPSAVATVALASAHCWGTLALWTALLLAPRSIQKPNDAACAHPADPAG